MRMQVGETEPFICELLNSLTVTIQDLETHQIHMFYEAVGLMISADGDPKKREQYLVRAQLSLEPISAVLLATWLHHSNLRAAWPAMLVTVLTLASWLSCCSVWLQDQPRLCQQL